MTGILYNFWGSTGRGINFLLSFLLLSICDNSQIFPLYVAAAIRCCWHSLLLTYYVQYSGQDTVAATAIMCLILWVDQFFVGRSFTWDGYWSIKSIVASLLSGTLLMFSHPLCLILSYRVSTAVSLVVMHICFRPYPLSPSSSRISFVVPIVTDLLVWPTNFRGDASGSIVGSARGAPNNDIEKQVQCRADCLDGFLDAMGLVYLLRKVAETSRQGSAPSKLRIALYPWKTPEPSCNWPRYVYVSTPLLLLTEALYKLSGRTLEVVYRPIHMPRFPLPRRLPGAPALLWGFSIGTSKASRRHSPPLLRRFPTTLPIPLPYVYMWISARSGVARLWLLFRCWTDVLSGAGLGSELLYPLLCPFWSLHLTDNDNL